MKTTVEFDFPEDERLAVDDLGCYENIERHFGFEFSCGDGIFLSDIFDDVYMLEKYDGCVDVGLIRLKNGAEHRGSFTIRYKYDDRLNEMSDFQLIRRR